MTGLFLFDQELFVFLASQQRWAAQQMECRSQPRNKSRAKEPTRSSLKSSRKTLGIAWAIECPNLVLHISAGVPLKVMDDLKCHKVHENKTEPGSSFCLCSCLNCL